MQFVGVLFVFGSCFSILNGESKWDNYIMLTVVFYVILRSTLH
jgi:hypothetical protein